MNSSDYTSTDGFSPNTELENFENVVKTADYSYTFNENWLDHLSAAELVLFCIVRNLSCSFGYCFMMDVNLAKKARCSVRSIERTLRILEEKKFIYRNTYQTREGRKRHIVPKDRYNDYWHNVLSHPKIPQAVRKDFLKKTMNVTDGDDPKGTPQTPPPISPLSDPNPDKGFQPPKKGNSDPCTKNGGSIATTTFGGSLLLRNSSIKEERQTEGASSQTAVVVDSFETLIRRELKEDGITGQRAEMAVEYYRKNKEMVDKKDNPMGWIIQGVKKGWISDVVQQQKKEPLKEKTTAIEEADLPKAQAFLKNLNEKLDQDVMRVHASDNCIIVDLRKTGGMCPLPLREPKSYRSLWSMLYNNQQERACTFFKSELPEFILTLINGKGENHACV